MEEKKFDKNTVIGFLLIGVILIWTLYQNQVNQEKTKENTPTKVKEQNFGKEQGDSLVESNKDVIFPENTSIDSTSEKNELFSYSAKKVKAKNYFIELENEKLKFLIATKGGEIIEAKLKNVLTYDSLLVSLIKKNNHSFNISFFTNENKIVNTKNLFFEHIIKKTDKATTLTLRSKVSKEKYLEYTYVLYADSYLMDFKITSRNLYDIINVSKRAEISWIQKTVRLSKSVIYENKYTALKYRYNNNKVDNLSVASDDGDTEKNVNWISYFQHFFNTTLISDMPFKQVNFQSENLAKEEDKSVMYTKQFSSRIPLTLINNEFNQSLHWYFGPSDYKTLEKYDTYQIVDSVDLGWGIFGWLNRYVFIPVFDFLLVFLPHGIAIIVLTILVRLLMSPVTYKSYLSQAKMKILKPEITEINEKHKGSDKAMKRQQETMALYNKAGVNPMSGCIPGLIQIPIFYALFMFFPTAYALRQKQFLWADDLSSYDAVAQLPFSIPFYGAHISLFPLLASISIFIYMKMTTGQSMAQTQQPGMPNMKFLLYLSPIMMLFFFNNYASGLSLYYFISNLITIFIMLVIKRYIIDENKILLQIEENKKKPKKQNKFQQKMKEMMKEAEKRNQMNKNLKK